MKIAILGSTNSGKTTLIKRLTTGEFEKNYVSTVGVEVRPLGSNSIWEATGQKRFEGLLDGYVIGAEKVFLVLDGSKRFDLHDNIRLLETWKRIAPKAPLSIIVTKSDIEEQKLEIPEYLSSYPTYYVSSKTGEGIASLREVLSQ